MSRKETGKETTLGTAAAIPQRRIGLFDATSLVVGGIVGSGIFLAPAAIARSLPEKWMILSVWAVTGLISFLGALAYAELGAMLPSSGGQYVYLRESYGPLIAFLFNWTSFLIIQTGTIAALAVGFAIYAAQLVPLSAWEQTAMALGLIVGLTVLNIYGLKEAVWFQTFCTVLRVAGLALIVGAAFLSHSRAGAATGVVHPGVVNSGAVAAAMSACFWTYEGWYLLGFVAGEVKQPKRTIPIALTVGMAIVIGIYLLANTAYLRVLPVGQIAMTDHVASAVAQSTMGRSGAVLVAVTILISIGGTNNAGVLSAPRLYFAQARDGLFFRAAGQLHPRWGTPVIALLLQAAWAAVLTLSGSYELLYNYVVFASWTFYGLAVSGVWILRRRHPDWERPYRMWGYPVTPVAFVLFAMWFLVSTIRNDPRQSLIGAGIVAAGIPAYIWWRRGKEAVPGS